MIYTYGTVVWVLKNYNILRCGDWPNPGARSDLGIPILHSAPYRAGFENPCLMAGEIARRVKRCGTDGFIVEECYGMHWYEQPRSVREIARERCLHENIIEHKINRVTWYVTDAVWSRAVPYEEWKNLVHGDRRYREKASS